MDLIKEFHKQEIARAYQNGNDISGKLDKIIQDIYDDGREMGLTEALNYVTDEQDRERLFSAIDEFAEARDNEC